MTFEKNLNPHSYKNLNSNKNEVPLSPPFCLQLIEEF